MINGVKGSYFAVFHPRWLLPMPTTRQSFESNSPGSSRIYLNKSGLFGHSATRQKTLICFVLEDEALQSTYLEHFSSFNLLMSIFQSKSTQMLREP